MPELPEIETVTRGLSHLTHSVIRDVVVRNANLRYKITTTLATDLHGQTIRQISRRAKYVIFSLSHGYLVMHLGMSGSITLLDRAQAPLPLKHDHVDIIANDTIIRFNDPRRFGCIVYTLDYQNHRLFSNLGVEPLTAQFNTQYLLSKLKSRKAPIKQLIMDNKIVVGVGNIYAAEALFMAKISPLRMGCSLNQAETSALVAAIKSILKQAIKHGGSSLRDYKHTDGSLGYFQHVHMVYNKLGQPCTLCSTPIIAKQLGQRTSYFCPTCQK